MGIVVLSKENEGHQLGRLPDPAGGTFDAAGDFDRLLSLTEDGYPQWSTIEPHTTTVMASCAMPALLDDLSALRHLAGNSHERRGLARLVIMAEQCRERSNLSLWFVGD